MKTTKLFMLILAITVSSVATAQKQKVKEKDDVYSIDGVPFLKKSCKNLVVPPCVFSSATGDKKYFAWISIPYTKKIKTYEGGYWHTKDVNAYYYNIKFLDSEKSFYTSQLPKKLILNMYNSAIIDQNGEIDQTKLDEFIKINGEEEKIILYSN